MLAGIGHNGCLLRYRCRPVHNGLTGDQNESGDPGRPVAPATHYRRIIPSAVVRCTPNPTPSEALEIVMTPRSWFACAAATVMGIVTPAGAAPPGGCFDGCEIAGGQACDDRLDGFEVFAHVLFLMPR